MRTDRQLIDALRDSDPSAVEELIARYAERMRALLRRWRVADADIGALLGDVAATVIDRIRSDRLREPEALDGFFRAAARRRVTVYRLESAPEPHPGLVQTAAAVLASMPERDREVLIRFYLGEQTPEQICQTFQITADECRLMRSHARMLFAAGRKYAGRASAISCPAEAQRCVA